MPFGNTYSNGYTRFSTKSVQALAVQVIPTTTPSNIISIGVGCDIKSDVIGETFIIVDITSTTIAHFTINGVVSWTLSGTQITIFSMDNITYYLNFNSNTEAAIGDLRLYKIMEGDSIVNCGDEGALPLVTEGGESLTTEDGQIIVFS